MKTRSSFRSVRIFLALISCYLCLSGIVHADGVQFRTADIATPASIDFSRAVTQLPIADAYNPDGNPFESLRQPWYIRMWPESRILRILIIGGIIMGIKALFSKKSGTHTVSSQQQAVQRTTKQTTTPLASPPSASAQPTVSGWFYHANGTDFGPFDEAALRQLKNAGVFDPATYIRRADGGNWITYAEVFGSN